MTLIHIQKSVLDGVFLPRGYYESHIGISSDTGASLPLFLRGAYWPRGSDQPPMVYTFAIEEVYANTPIPYSLLEAYTSVQNSLEVATLTYTSPQDAATVSIACDPHNQDRKFKFVGEHSSFPCRLVYVPIIGAQSSIVEINDGNHTFATESVSYPSPVDGSFKKEHRLTGKLRIFLASDQIPPLAGSYCTTIYIKIASQN